MVVAWLLFLLFASGASSEAPPSFDRIEDEILAPRCGVPGCHNGYDSVMGLDLRRGKAWDSLVGRPSREMASLGLGVHFLVAPGEPEESYLMRKLRGEHGILGEQMPLSGPCLDAEEIEAIRRWIAAGAMPPENPVPPPPEPKVRRIVVPMPAASEDD